MTRKQTTESSLYATKCKYGDTHKYRYIGQSDNEKDIYRCKYCLEEVAMTPIEAIGAAGLTPVNTKSATKKPVKSTKAKSK